MQPTQPGLAHRLARVNPTKAFLGALALVLAGLFLPGIIGGLVLLLLAAGLIALIRLTWSIQAPQTRMIRLVMLTGLIGIAILKIL
ncbi:hypothetical protein O7635_37495 [Asanoa sp. WMMD1127]|uniref:DUF6703 family protein n=1 Tax=Asanoa sp. WMMD1127 TaxID=3016107 RepID=UPI0024162C8D|nr:DUF6703 family protein [Asanoa sp. WMMD1127]MDG4827571.1 hypothetical protein [Asanoa sp. WMMD1127]